MHKPTILLLSCFSLFLYHDASGMKRKLSSFGHLSLDADDACEKTPTQEQDEDDIEHDDKATRITANHAEKIPLLRLLSADQINSDNERQINTLMSSTKQNINFNKALENSVSKGHVPYIEKFLPYASQEMHVYIRCATYGAKPSVSLPLILPFTSNLSSIDKDGLDQAKLTEVNKAIKEHENYVAALPLALENALSATMPVKPLRHIVVAYVAMPLTEKNSKQ